MNVVSRWVHPYEQTMRRIPPSVDEALRLGLVKMWAWRPQAHGEPLVEVVTVRGRTFVLPEAEAEAFAEGVLAVAS